MDTFQIDSTLKQLSSRPILPSTAMLTKEKELETKEPQVISGCWVDKDGVTLAVYFSWSKVPKPEDEEAGGEKGKVNQSKDASLGVWQFGTYTKLVLTYIYSKKLERLMRKRLERLMRKKLERLVRKKLERLMRKKLEKLIRKRMR